MSSPGSTDSMTETREMVESLVGKDPVTLTFALWFFIGIGSLFLYLPISILTLFSFRMKFKHHQLMLDQMESFDVRAARCTLPADRHAIEQHVKELFQQSDALQEPDDSVDEGEVRLQRFYPLDAAFGGDPLDKFNDYVRGRLRDFIIAQIGNELHVPYGLALTSFLPMIFYSSVNVLGCDNKPCDKSAVAMGYSSVSSYMTVNASCWAFHILTVVPVTYPLLLRLIKSTFFFGDGPLQLLAAVLCLPLVYLYNGICIGLGLASLTTLAQQFSPTQLWIFLGVATFLVTQTVLFFRGGSKTEDRSMMPCRCIKRQEASYDPLRPAVEM